MSHWHGRQNSEQLEPQVVRQLLPSGTVKAEQVAVEEAARFEMDCWHCGAG